jgi:hypothetical protein
MHRALPAPILSEGESLHKFPKCAEAVIRRSRAFYQATSPGHFLINAMVPAETPDIPSLRDFDLDHQLTEWLDGRLAAARAVWRAKAEWEDDSIPSICPHFGICEHSAWLGQDAVLQSDTCLPVPALKSPEDLEGYRLSRQTKWFQYMKKGYDYLRSKKDGTFVLSIRGTMTPMDMASAWRGNELYLDFILRPEFVHRLMKFLAEAIPWYYRQLSSWADDIGGGHVFYFGGGWMDKEVIGHISNDAAMLCSPEVYDEFGFPYEAELAKKYRGVFYHVHNEKLHFVPRVAQLPGMTMLEVSNDPKTPGALDDLDRIFAATGSANLMLRGTADEVRASIDRLKERNVFLQVSCRDRAEAKDIIALVRDRSKPLG